MAIAIPGYQLTHTGRKFHPLNLQADELFIEDIAHGLAAEPRYLGQTERPYSVAQHSVLVSYICDEGDELAGLLHDGSEAILRDMPAPIKYDPMLDGYRELEERVQQKIYARFGIAGPIPPSVKRADMVLRATELRDFFGVKAEGEYEPMEGKLDIWTFEQSKKRFLDRFAELTR